MSLSFAADWLALREPVDHAARDRGLAEQLAARLAGRSYVAIVDLGSGTGSNWRWLAPRLPGSQSWRLVEHDPALIAAGLERHVFAPDVRHVQADLAGSLGSVLAPPVDLVTASALVDLVSLEWATQLVELVGRLRCGLYLALTYDGRIALSPPDPDDVAIIGLVNRHQTTDKGFGPALGPDAVAALVELLRAREGSLRLADSTWRLGPGEVALQLALIEGWAQAAAEVDDAAAARSRRWAERRTAHVARGQARARVGHQDLLWLPQAVAAPRRSRRQT